MQGVSQTPGPETPSKPPARFRFRWPAVEDFAAARDFSDAVVTVVPDRIKTARNFTSIERARRGTSVALKQRDAEEKRHVRSVHWKGAACAQHTHHSNPGVVDHPGDRACRHRCDVLCRRVARAA